MRKYDAALERAIRIDRLVQEWTRSGLLDASQRDQIVSSLEIDLRRTNAWLRGILFGFGGLIVTATVLLAMTSGIADEAICFVAAAGCLLLTELLISRFRLYRFGVEESAAVGFGVLASAACMLIVENMQTRSGEFPEFVGLVAGAAAGFTIYRRYGYVYAAVAAILCLGFAPFQTAASDMVQRLITILLLSVVFGISRYLRRRHGDEFPGDEYGALQAFSWIAIYAFLNLKLFSNWFGVGSLPNAFYWFTYAAIWIMPAVGLWLSLRDRDHPLLAVSLLTALLTLVSNKPYLGLTRQTWDPILFGLLLIGTALAVRRWLVGEKHGFTASRILTSDKRHLAVINAASVTFQPGPTHHDGPSSEPEPFKPGGGRSGGAGASGTF